MVAGIVLIFAFTFLGIVWLARDVDRGVSNRSAAQSIAFQAGAVRGAVGIDRRPAQQRRRGRHRRASGATGWRQPRLMHSSRAYDVDGSITSIDVDGDRVAVTVVITDGSVTVTGAGTVRAERAP